MEGKTGHNSTSNIAHNLDRDSRLRFWADMSSVGCFFGFHPTVRTLCRRERCLRREIHVRVRPQTHPRSASFVSLSSPSTEPQERDVSPVALVTFPRAYVCGRATTMPATVILGCFDSYPRKWGHSGNSKTKQRRELPVRPAARTRQGKYHECCIAGDAQVTCPF